MDRKAPIIEKELFDDQPEIINPYTPILNIHRKNIKLKFIFEELVIKG